MKPFLTFTAFCMAIFILTSCGANKPLSAGGNSTTVTSPPNTTTLGTPNACSTNVFTVSLSAPASLPVIQGGVTNFQVNVTGGSGNFLYSLGAAVPSIAFQKGATVSTSFQTVTTSQVQTINVADAACPSQVVQASSPVFAVVAAQTVPTAVACTATPFAPSVNLLTSPTGTLYSPAASMTFLVASTVSTVPISITSYNLTNSATGSTGTQPVTNNQLPSIAMPVGTNVITFSIASSSNASLVNTCQATVVVNSQAIACQVQATPSTIAVGSSSSLQIAITGTPKPDSMAFTNSLTTVYTAATPFTPTSVGNYPIGANLTFGSSVVPCAAVTVTVTASAPPIPTVSLTSVNTNQSTSSTATLSWTTSNASQCTLSSVNGSNAVAVNSSQPTGILSSITIYTLTCSNSTGSNFSTVTVNPYVAYSVTYQRTNTNNQAGGACAYIVDPSNGTNILIGCNQYQSGGPPATNTVTVNLLPNACNTLELKMTAGMVPTAIERDTANTSDISKMQLSKSGMKFTATMHDGPESKPYDPTDSNPQTNFADMYFTLTFPIANVTLQNASPALSCN